MSSSPSGGSPATVAPATGSDKLLNLIGNSALERRLRGLRRDRHPWKLGAAAAPDSGPAVTVTMIMGWAVHLSS